MTSLRFPMELDNNGLFAVDTGTAGDADTGRNKDRSKILLTLGTAVGERVMRPDFGVDTLTSFYMAGEDIEDGIILAIQTAFQEFFNGLYGTSRILVQSIEVKPDPHFDGSVMYVDVLWRYPNSNEPAAVTSSVNVSGLMQQIGSA